MDQGIKSHIRIGKIPPTHPTSKYAFSHHIKISVITQAKLGVLMRERLRLPLEGKLSAKRTDEVECSNQSNY
jgi:hypothetical protein